MSGLLHLGDAVLVKINDSVSRIGWIKCWVKFDKRTYVGVELVEAIPDGHDGKVNGRRHFKAEPGHGSIVPISDIVKKLTPEKIGKKMQQIISLCINKFHLYIEALDARDAAIVERDEIIKKLTETVLRLKDQNGKDTKNVSNKIGNDLSAPEPITDSMKSGSIESDEDGAIYAKGIEPMNISYSPSYVNLRKKKKKKAKSKANHVVKGSEFTKFPKHIFSIEPDASLSDGSSNGDFVSSDDFDDDGINHQKDKPNMPHLMQSVSYTNKTESKPKAPPKGWKKRPNLRTQRSRSLIISPMSGSASSGSRSRSYNSSEAAKSHKSNNGQKSGHQAAHPKLRRKRSRSVIYTNRMPRKSPDIQYSHSNDKTHVLPMNGHGMHMHHHPHVNASHGAPMHSQNNRQVIKIPHSVPTPHEMSKSPRYTLKMLQLEEDSSPSPHLRSPPHGMIHPQTQSYKPQYHDHHRRNQTMPIMSMGPLPQMYAKSHDVYPMKKQTGPPLHSMERGHSLFHPHQQFGYPQQPQMRQMKQPGFSGRKRSISMDDLKDEENGTQRMYGNNDVIQIPPRKVTFNPNITQKHRNVYRQHPQPSSHYYQQVHGNNNHLYMPNDVPSMDAYAHSAEH